MAGSLGTLTLDLIARIGGFTAPLTAAEEAAKRAADAIRDSAGEAGSAWGGLGEIVAGAAAAFSIGAVFNKFIQNTIDAENEQAQLNAVLRATGNSAGYTADQLNDMASAMSSASTFSGGDFSTAQTTLLAFTGVVGKEFPRALQAAADMAARTGMTVQAAAETIGRALDIPSAGLTSLSKQGFRFTDDQKKLAIALESVGDVAGAQAIILQALEESYGGAAEAARNTLGGSLIGLTNSIDDLLTQDGGLPAVTSAVNLLSDAFASPAARTGLNLTIQAAGVLAAVLATRLVASVVASGISFSVATVQAVQYQLVLARMAGVAPATAAGLIAVGGAARIAGAAMALLGGPVGIAILAVAAGVAYLATKFYDGADAAKELTEQVDYMNASFEGLTRNQATAKLADVTQALNDVQLRAIDARTAVDQYQRLLRDHPNDARVQEWNAALIQAQGELDTTSKDVDTLQGKIRELYAVMAQDVPVIGASKAYTDLAAKIDEQILVADKKTNADKLQARISAGLVTGLKEGEGELLVAKQRTLDKTLAAVEAEKARTAAAKAASTAAATADAAVRKRAQDAAESYERQIALINISGDASKKATEVSKLRFELESGKLKDINAQEQARLLNLAAQLDAQLKLQKAAEEAKKAASFAQGLQDTNTTVRQGFKLELAGQGTGDKLKERLKADLAIQHDYLNQASALQAQYQSKDISESLYKTETEMLDKALKERQQLQTEYYEQLDESQNDWLAGVSSAWENYRDIALDYQSQAADGTAALLDETTSGLVSAFDSVLMKTATVGEATRGLFAGIGRTALTVIEEIAAKWAVTTAMRLLGIGQETTEVVASETIKKGAQLSTIAVTQAASLGSIATTLAANVSAAATTVASWLPAALVASIGTFGAAAAVGLAAVLGVMAITGGFESGGYTGNGGRSDVAGVVHGQEFVMNAAATARIGVANLEAMQRGEVVQDGAWLQGGGAATVARTDSQSDSAMRAAQGSGNGVGLTVNLVEDASKAGQQKVQQTDTQTFLTAWVANLYEDGEVMDALSRKIGAKPVGQ